MIILLRIGAILLGLFGLLLILMLCHAFAVVILNSSEEDKKESK